MAADAMGLAAIGAAIGATAAAEAGTLPLDSVSAALTLSKLVRATEGVAAGGGGRAAIALAASFSRMALCSGGSTQVDWLVEALW